MNQIISRNGKPTVSIIGKPNNALYEKANKLFVDAVKSIGLDIATDKEVRNIRGSIESDLVKMMYNDSVIVIEDISLELIMDYIKSNDFPQCHYAQFSFKDKAYIVTSWNKRINNVSEFISYHGMEYTELKRVNTWFFGCNDKWYIVELF